MRSLHAVDTKILTRFPKFLVIISAMILLNIFYFVVSFIILWFSTGLILSSVEHISKRIKISSFSISFFVLGILTSIPELALGINSIIVKNPSIYVGNLIGATITIFLFVIPVFAILSNGVKLNHEIKGKNMFMIFLVIIAPSIFLINGSLTVPEGFVLIFLYLFLFLHLEKSQNLLEKIESIPEQYRNNIEKNFLKIVFGIVLVLFSANQIIKETVYFSNSLGISTFLIGLLFLSIGTNLPELFLGIRSALDKKRSVAFGDYLGSATTNSLLFGVLTIINGKTISINGNSAINFAFLILALAAFYYFSRSKNDISRAEGIILLIIYLCFLGTVIIVNTIS